MANEMLEILSSTLWVCFLLYATWYLTSAKDFAPLTREEAELLWKIHKQDMGCKAKRWYEIRHEGELVGFECECGYVHVQKRPIFHRSP